MKTHTIYRKPNSNDFGSQHTFIDKDISVVGLIEVTMVQHKKRFGLFVGSKDVMYYCEFRAGDNKSFSHIERCREWFENISLCWEDVTISSLEACGFERVEA